MSQKGPITVTVTNGDATVTTTGGDFLTSIAAGQWFTVVGSGVAYQIASVTDDNNFELSANYAGTTNASASAVIQTSYTSNLNLPKLERGDIETPTIFGRHAEGVELALAAQLSLSVAGSSNVTLTPAQYAYGSFTFTGALTGSINVIWPDKARLLNVYNNTSGAYTLTVKASGTGIAIAQGKSALIWCDGTTMRPVVTDLRNPNIVGTATNDSAPAGSVGELISSTVLQASRVGLTTATQTNVTSISLTAGDWDVSGLIGFSHNSSTTWPLGIGSISATSATVSSDEKNSSNVCLVPAALDLANIFYPLPTVRVSLAATTTYYLVAYASFTGGSGQAAFGTIRGRRVR